MTKEPSGLGHRLPPPRPNCRSGKAVCPGTCVLANGVGEEHYLGVASGLLSAAGEAFKGLCCWKFLGGTPGRAAEMLLPFLPSSRRGHNLISLFNHSSSPLLLNRVCTKRVGAIQDTRISVRTTLVNPRPRCLLTWMRASRRSQWAGQNPQLPCVQASKTSVLLCGIPCS